MIWTYFTRTIYILFECKDPVSGYMLNKKTINSQEAFLFSSVDIGRFSRSCSAHCTLHVPVNLVR